MHRFKTPKLARHTQTRHASNKGWAGAFLVTVLLMSSLSSGADLTQRRVVGNLEIALSISSPGHGNDQGRALASPPSTNELHTLSVTIVDRSTRSPVTRARVTASVKEETYAGADYALIPAAGSEPGGYFAEVPMPGRATYRILVQVHVAGAPRTREAQFRYRHHH
jgi:hypothetical protein